MSKNNSANYTCFLSFPFGSLTLFVFTDGASELPAIQPMFAPKAELSQIEAVLSNHFLNTEKLTLAGNNLLIKKGDKTILIDTGCGTHLFPTTGKLLQNLLAAGIAAEDITDIVLTHAHPDHIGGILDKDNALIFPNATVYLSKTEYDFWMSENPDFSKGTQNEAADFEIMFAKRFINAIKEDVQFYEDNTMLFDCLKLRIAPGHTPGHAITEIFSEGNELVHIADIFQHILLVEHPEWGNQIDADFELGIATRKKVLAALATSKKLVFANHLPYPGLGYIKQKEQGYEWVPKAFYTV